MNVYRFKGLRDYGSYFNDNFQRGRFDLLANVKRSSTRPSTLAISTPKSSCPRVDEFLSTGTSYIQYSFPAKLYNLLETADNKSVIDWLPSGLAFKVHDRPRFVNEILPKYFNRK